LRDLRGILLVFVDFGRGGQRSHSLAQLQTIHLVGQIYAKHLKAGEREEKSGEKQNKTKQNKTKHRRRERGREAGSHDAFRGEGQSKGLRGGVLGRPSTLHFFHKEERNFFTT